MSDANLPVRARVDWQHLLEAVWDATDGEMIGDSDISEHDAERLEAAAKTIRWRLRRGTPKGHPPA